MTIVGANCFNLSTSVNLDRTTAVGYSAGRLYANSGGVNNTYLGSNTDLSGSFAYVNSFCVGANSIITGSYVGVLGTTSTSIIIPSATVQYGNAYRPHSVFQTITGATNWDTTPLIHYQNT